MSRKKVDETANPCYNETEVARMALIDKIQGLLAMGGKSMADYARAQGVTTQAVFNKFKRGSFSVEDLIKIADFTGADISVKTADGSVIIFSMKDLANK